MKIQVKGIEAALRSVALQQQKIVASEKAKLMQKYVVQLKEATPVDTGEARDGWAIKQGKIVNEVPHIDMLNHGHSDQAPSFFIEATLLSNPEVKPGGLIVTE